MNIKSFDSLDIISAVFPQIPEEPPLTKEQLCTNLANIIEPNIANGDLDAEVFVSNYVYISQFVIADLCEINERLVKIRNLDRTVPPNEDYTHRKLRYFSELNKKARDEIIAFLSQGLLEFLLENKKIDFVARQNDKLLNLRLQGCYEYGFFKKYYDCNYDFSTEAKVRFIPGVTVTNLLESVDKYIKLKIQNFSDYQAELCRMVNENDVLSYLCSRIEGHNVMNRRLEVFDTMKTLYATQKWQSFISLAVLQIEGLFYDCCKVLNSDTLSGTAGTLVEKVDKSFKDNHIIMLSVYPYYMFDIPVLRNEIAHTGLIDRSNLEHLANELILDLNTMISWIYQISHEKYTIISMISDAVDRADSATQENSTTVLLGEMLSCMGISNFDYLDFLKNPTLFRDEIKYMKTPEGYWEQIAQKINNIIKTKEFWEEIEDHIDITEVFDPQKPFNLVVLADKLKNTFISILDKDSPEKVACQKVASKIQKCKNT